MPFDDPFPPLSGPASPGGGDEAALRAFDVACDRVLARLLGPLVHGLNNLLTNAVGHADLIEGPEDAGAVRRPLLELSRRLRIVAELSKQCHAAPGLEQMVAELDLLFGRLAEKEHVALELLSLANAAEALPGGLQEACAVLLGRELLAAAAADGPDRRVRLRTAVGEPGRLRVWIGASPVAGRDEARERDVARCVEARLAHPRPRARHGPRVRVRSSDGARVWCVELGCALRDALPRPPAAGRVLLVDPDDATRDVLAELLAEELRVRAAPDRETALASPGGPFALVLLTARALDEDPGLAELSRNGLRLAERGRVAVLGEGPVALPGASVYRGPMLPDPLLAFVRDLIPR